MARQNYLLLSTETEPMVDHDPKLQRRSAAGFTLAELLVTVGVLVLLVFLATQLLNSTAAITTLAHKKMDVDSQAREILDRMAIDFAEMVKRSDVDYYLKSLAAAPLRSVPQAGNDQIAFYSIVAGYYGTVPTPAPTFTTKSPLSLVGYRINGDSTSASYNKMERLGRGLAWNGFSSQWTPVVFMPIPLASALPLGPTATPTATPTGTAAPTPTPTASPTPAWPDASSATAIWSESEVIGPQVFRFEYYYLLNDGTLSGTPWVTSTHTDVNGMQDVAAIVVDIAAIDPKSKVLLTDAQLATLTTPGNANFLADYSAGMTPGQLRTQWENTVNTITSLPRPAVSGIRLYERYFYLSPPTLLTP
jgi:hypothetical protein